MKAPWRQGVIGGDGRNTQEAATFCETGSSGIRHRGLPFFTGATISGSSSHGFINSRHAHSSDWNTPSSHTRVSPGSGAAKRKKRRQSSLWDLLPATTSITTNPGDHLFQCSYLIVQTEADQRWAWRSLSSSQHVSEWYLVTVWLNMRSLCRLLWPLPWSLPPCWKEAAGSRQP